MTQPRRMENIVSTQTKSRPRRSRQLLKGSRRRRLLRVMALNSGGEFMVHEVLRGTTVWLSSPHLDKLRDLTRREQSNAPD